ncbi:hypothetical protein U9Y30_24690, partial [Escherichia coli]
RCCQYVEKFAFLFCESGFVVDQVNNLSLSCGLFSELPNESDPFLQPFDVADAHVRDAPWCFFAVCCGRAVYRLRSAGAGGIFRANS